MTEQNQQPITSAIPIYIKFINVDWTININQISIDTRDFDSMIITDNHIENNPKHKISRKYDEAIALKYPNRFIYTIEEIKKYMTIAYERSGGSNKWRYLCYKNYRRETYGWELKYILIHKIADNQYVILSKHDKIYNELEADVWYGKLLRKEMWESPIDEFVLNSY